MNNIYNDDTLKQQYMDIDIPVALDEAILEGLNRGKRKAGYQRMKRITLSAAAVLLIVVSALTVGVNVSPAFADALSDMPRNWTNCRSSAFCRRNSCRWKHYRRYGYRSDGDCQQRGDRAICNSF